MMLRDLRSRFSETLARIGLARAVLSGKAGGGDGQNELDPRSKQLVRHLFWTLLAREASESELTNFVRQLHVGKLDPLGLLELLLASPECWHGKIPLFVPPGHYYSPVADPRQLDRTAFPPASIEPPLDVQLDIESMVGFWNDVLPDVQRTPFPEEKSEGFRYFFSNPSFSFGDAIILRAMIRRAKPKRFVEVGSGYSSACTLDTIDEAQLDTKVTLVDPYPDLVLSLIRPSDQQRLRIIASGVQQAPLSTFLTLEAGDILFIDSTHIVKPGSDVAYELAEVLPRVKPGVLIHFHDIFYPFEYPAHWAIDENRSWNELYAIRAFLAYNDRFRVVFFNHMFASLRAELARSTYPAFLRNCGGGLWLERIH